MKKQYNFRLEEELMNKFEKYAEEEERSTAQQITFLIKKYIKEKEESQV